MIRSPPAPGGRLARSEPKAQPPVRNRNTAHLERRRGVTMAEGQSNGSPTTMLSSVVEPGIGTRLEEVPVPAPAAGEVLVRSTAVGICGSDTHALASHHPFLTAPYVPGHEATGVVVSFGAEVYGLSLIHISEPT